MLGMMRRQVLLVFSFALLSAADSLAQQQAMLPDHLGDGTATSPIFKPSPPGDSQVWREAGVVASEARMYSNHIQVDLYRFRDPSGAYAIVTYLTRGPRISSAGGTQIVPVPRRDVMVMKALDEELFQVGNFVAKIYAAEKDPALSMKRAVTDAVRKSADATPLPPIRMYLPDEGRVGGTERYALGPIGFRAAAAGLDRADFAALADQAGFNSGAEAMLARYRRGKDEGVLLLLDYPTPQLAEQHLRHLEIALPQYAREAGTPIERKGSLLAIVLSPSSAHYAKSLRDAVNYETQVTWNEPSATATDPPWPSVIAQIFIGTGVFMVAAVVLGIAFGGLRVVTKIFFPGKVFDRPERMEILQLGLSGKKIDPSDFY
jgi:hypothetical protein